ncbi:MAG: hypothetical protein Q4C77_19660 [Eubacteriales bacterium]|nr:hypothetical protein [Eubacteriales bacterium]
MLCNRYGVLRRLEMRFERLIFIWLICDSPAGKYEFLGLVKHEDGTPLGTKEGDLIQFDPGIFIDDDKTIYLYSGNAPMKKEYANGRQGSQVMKLKEDMRHELCYAVSDMPDAGYWFGGTLVDIGDIFLDGRTEAQAVNCLGNTHGGIEKAGDQWYVFYHRQTNRTNYSRQSCAEEI